MEFGPMTKIDKRNMTTSSKIDDDVMLANCDVIILFPIYSYPEARFRAHGL